MPENDLNLTLRGQQAQDYIDYLAEQRAKKRIAKLREDALIAMETIAIIFTEAEQNGYTAEYATQQAEKQITDFKETDYTE